jgi:uncharacterized Zn-finger protein
MSFRTFTTMLACRSSRLARRNSCAWAHVFLDLGNDNEIICPYCSTLYRYASDLAAGEARPPECVVKDKAA